MPKGCEDRPLKYRELRKKLRKFGVKEIVKRGKGSERMFFHPNIYGCPAWYPVKCHGEGTEISKAVVGAARRAFRISPQDFWT